MSAARKLHLPFPPHSLEVMAKIEQRAQQAVDAARSGRFDESTAAFNLATDYVESLKTPSSAPPADALVAVAAWKLRAKSRTVAHYFRSAEVSRSVCGLVSQRQRAWYDAPSAERRCEHCRRATRGMR